MTTIFPLGLLDQPGDSWWALGLLAALVIGFGFGFVLERAGFGRATTLVGQFYLYDMTVFKVMFGAIVTAMLGLVVLAGLGLADLTAISESAASATYLWPMLVGGLLLGAGFIVSGYCPGTSLVAGSSGNLDGLLTFGGVIVGSLLFGELYPWLRGFMESGDLGHFFLYQALGVPPAVVAGGVVAMAVACFIGAEKVERIFTRAWRGQEPLERPARPRRLVFASFGAATALGLLLLLVPARGPAVGPGRTAGVLSARELALAVVEAPWSVRVLDLRPQAECVAERVPGAECVALEALGQLDLGAGAARDLVLVGALGVDPVPAELAAYGGRVLVLSGGHAAWRRFAREEPEPLLADASGQQRAEHELRAALRSMLTGQAAAPPPPPPLQAAVPSGPKKKKGGGCDG